MITREQIEAIVDGECSHESRALILGQMESQASGWRSLALALLEEQQWARQITSLAKYNASVVASQESDTLSFKYNSTDAPSLPSARLESVHEASSKDSVRGIALWWLALAASLFLCLGFYGGSWLPSFTNWKSTRIDTEAIVRSSSTSDPSRETISASNSMDTDMKMLVSGPNQQTAEIPIYDVKSMDHEVFAARERYEVAKINQRLRKEGFELDVRPEYYTGRLNDGRQLIVPVRHLGVKPYGQ